MRQACSRRAVVYRQQQVAAEFMTCGFETENHFEIGRVDSSENAQASVGALDADPLFTAIADFREKIFDGLLGDLKAPARDP